MQGLSHVRHKIGPTAFRLMYIKIGPWKGIAVAEREHDREVILVFLHKPKSGMQHKLPICQLLLRVRMNKDDDPQV